MSTFLETYSFSTPIGYFTSLKLVKYTQWGFESITKLLPAVSPDANKKHLLGVFMLCAGMDSNHRIPKEGDLQSPVIAAIRPAH
mgnify:CR=1 FL=1